RDHALVRRARQVVPALRRRLDDLRVRAERDRAPVRTRPHAVGILHPDGNRVPRRRLVWSEMPLLRGEDPERRRDVEAVRLARLPLEALDRLDLLGGAVVLALARHLDAVLLRELVAKRALVGPVGRLADDVQVPFLLRLLDQPGEAVGAERARQRAGRLRAAAPAGCEKACDRAGRKEARSAAAAS